MPDGMAVDSDAVAARAHAALRVRGIRPEDASEQELVREYERAARDEAALQESANQAVAYRVDPRSEALHEAAMAILKEEGKAQDPTEDEYAAALAKAQSGEHLTIAESVVAQLLASSDPRIVSAVRAARLIAEAAGEGSV